MIPEHLQPPKKPVIDFEAAMIEDNTEPESVIRCFQVPGTHAEGCELHDRP